MWPRLLHTGPGDDPANGLPAQPSLGSAPSLGALVTDTVTELIENQATGTSLLAEAMTGVLRAVRNWLSGADAPEPMSPAASSMSGPVPHTAFNAPLTHGARWPSPRFR